MKFVSLILLLSTLFSIYASSLFAQVDAGADVQYLCNQNSVQLQASEGFQSYSWTPTTGLSDPSIANPIAGPYDLTQGPITYTLTAIAMDGTSSSDDIFISINPIVPTEAGTDTLICAGEPVILGANSVSPQGSTYTWSPDLEINDVNAENPTVTPSSTTTYVVSSSNSECTGSDLVTVIVEENNSLGFSFESSPSCDGLNLSIENESPFAQDYIWDFGDGTSSSDYSPEHLFPYGAPYTINLSITSALGCVHQVSDELIVNDFNTYFDVKLPNVISPNFDGVNDVLDINIKGDVVECISMQVFNRWGQVVFESTGSNTRWDGYSIAGELAPTGLYFYTIDFKDATYKGSVEVMY